VRDGPGNPPGRMPEFGVLGTLRVLDGARELPLPGGRERAVLAHLVASAGRTVSTDDLVRTLWLDAPPRTAAKALQNHVVRLRKVLEPERDGSPRLLVTEAGGYRLDVPDDAVDARRFELLVGLGARALSDGRAAAAAAALDEALVLWRGRPYAGLESAGFVVAETRRLEELRANAREHRLEAWLRLGRNGDALAEARALADDEPLRERSWELLVRALYGEGRQAEALEAYGQARDHLREELGLEPGPALRRLHAQVLAQDPELDRLRGPAHLPVALTPPSGRFVGRDDALEWLRDAWRRVVTDGHPRTVVVRGPVGSGVRRLVAELAAELADEGVAVVLGGPRAPVDAASSLCVLDRRESTRPGPGDGGGDSPAVGDTPVADAPVLTVVLARPSTPVPDAHATLELGPIGAAAVEALLAEYLPDPPSPDLVAEVLRVSGGRPARVHDEALTVARRRLSVRVSGAVSQVVAAERVLADVRDDLRDGVAAYRELVEQDAVREPGSCPWKGLTAYGIDDAPWYAGRERLVAELLSRLAGAGLLAVVGASGSGKSSLLAAGLRASLIAGALPGSEHWRVITLRPGSHPTRALVAALLDRPDAPLDEVAGLLDRAVLGDGEPVRTLIVVDQIEEVWTTCSDDSDRQSFLDALADLAVERQGVTVVVGCRADRLDRVAEHEVLARILPDSTVVVGPPSQAELRRVVERPAERGGLGLEDGLADALVEDTGREPGALPLLSTAMSELWERREGRRLTLAAYVATGGVSGAVARLAERAWADLDAAGQEAARALLLRLAGPGEGSDVTRRRVPLEELTALPDPRVPTVVDRLAEARLLTVDSNEVEVAHEALFREWPRLAGWLEDRTAVRAAQGRLALAASEWERGGRDPGELWRGSRLAAGLEAAAAAPKEVTSVERAFLEAARSAEAAAEAKQQAQARDTVRQNRRLRWLLAGTAVGLVAAVVAGGVALRAERTAEREARTATARQLAASADAVQGSDPELGVLLATEAIRTTRGADGTVLPEATNALRRAVAASRVQAVFPGTGGLIAWSPDGSAFVTEGPEGTGLVEVRDPVTGEVLRSWVGHDVDVNDVAFGADGTLATAGDDGAVIAWDPATGEERGRIEGPAGPVWSPSLSADGSLLAAQWANERRIVVARTAGGEEVYRSGPDESVGPARLDPSGTALARGVWDGTAVVIDVVDLATGEIRSLDGPGFTRWSATLLWSPDGRWIAAPGDGQLRIWDARSGRLSWSLPAQERFVPGLAWSADSAAVATASHDGTIRVWRVDHSTVRPLPALSALPTKEGLVGVAFSPDGRHVLAGDLNVKAVTRFDVSDTGGAEWAAVPTYEEHVSVAFLPDGDHVVVSGTERGARLVEARTGRVVRDLAAASDEGPAHQIEVSPDGDRVALSGVDSVRVVDLGSGQEAFRYTPHDEQPMELSWGAGGDLLAVADAEPGITVILDMAGDEVGRVTEEDGWRPSAVALSPDGAVLATGRDVTDDRPQLGRWSVTLWDWRSGDALHNIPTPAEGLEFSADGSVLVTTDVRGPAVVLDPTTGEALARLEGRLGGVQAATVSGDGRTVATANSDGTLSLWDVATETETAELPGHTALPSSVALSPDGSLLASAGWDGVARVWALDLDDLLRIADANVTRDLTPAECRRYLHHNAC